MPGKRTSESGKSGRVVVLEVIESVLRKGGGNEAHVGTTTV
jgi:hypothetical protein